DRPVVPRRVAGVLQLRVGDGEPECDGTVDDRDPQAVAVHVLEAQLRVAGAVAVVLDAGPPDRAEVLRGGDPARHPAAAEHAVITDPHGPAVALLDPRPAVREPAREPRLPHVARDGAEVAVVVTRVEGGGGVRWCRGVGHWVALLSARINVRNWFAGGPAVVPPSMGRTVPVICAARSLARKRTASATSPGFPARCSGCISLMIW